MEADIKGHQRKVIRSDVRPLKSAHGASGIALSEGRTLPFRVTRYWNAPAGHYSEQFFVVDRETREVLYEGPARDVLVWGLQSLTELVDEVREPFSLKPGTYLLVFALGGVMGAEVEVEAAEAPAEEAA